jgi:hypothetical protein
MLTVGAGTQGTIMVISIYLIQSSNQPVTGSGIYRADSMPVVPINHKPRTDLLCLSINKLILLSQTGQFYLPKADEVNQLPSLLIGASTD